MATINNDGSAEKGQLAKVTYYQINGITIARAARNNRTKTGNTPASLAYRTKVANLNANWRTLKRMLDDTFEDRKPLASAFNGFTSNNLSRTEVRLTKRDGELGTAVADHFVVSHGTLPQAIQTELRGGRLWSDIALSPLAEEEGCSLYNFGVALRTANPGRFQWGDEIRYVVLRQCVNLDTGLPFTTAAMCRLTLVEGDTRALADVVGGQPFGEGFTIAEGRLSAPAREGCLAAWIHLRPQRKGRPLASTQQLAGVNPMLERYTSAQALEEAIASYSE